MDAILRNQEIISHIAASVHWTHLPGYDIDLLHTLSFALTCKSFLEPALNLLWRKQLTLFNLIKTLPEDAWSICEGNWVSLDGVRQRFIVRIPQTLLLRLLWRSALTPATHRT